MRFIPVVLIAALAAVGCATDRNNPAVSLDDKAAAREGVASPSSTAASAPITFNDIGSFDNRLADSLDKRPEKVTVVMADRVPLKDMPERVNKWLAVVDGSGGAVEVKSDAPETKEGKTRALPLIGLLFSAFSSFKEFARERLYNPAKDYNATIFYKRDDKGDRVVERIEMTKRGGP